MIYCPVCEPHVKQYGFMPIVCIECGKGHTKHGLPPLFPGADGSPVNKPNEPAQKVTATHELMKPAGINSEMKK